MSLGCLAADRRRNLLVDTPALLLVSMMLRRPSNGPQRAETVLRVGNQLFPRSSFSGRLRSADPAHFVIPIEVVEAFFFLIVALVMVGPVRVGTGVQTRARTLQALPPTFSAVSQGFSVCAGLLA
jgi:hypothetical protein